MRQRHARSFDAEPFRQARPSVLASNRENKDMRAHRFAGLATSLILLVAVAACDGIAGPGSGDGAPLALGFQVAGADGASASVAADEPGLRASHEPSTPSVFVDGTNGELTVDAVDFIVSEFELEREDDDGACDDDAADNGSGGDDGADDDGCEDVEAGPLFLSLPLSGERATLVERQVPVGRYDEMEFEIEDLDDDEDDDDGAALQSLLTEVRDQFPDWPREASLRVHGFFTPKDAEGELDLEGEREFTAYFEAEVEIEMDFSPPLEVGDDSRTVTVQVDPRAWFRNADGTVRDLSAFDFDADAGSPVVDLEVEMEDGFTEIEFDD